ncbi:MAG: hypothetical protein ACM3S0_16260 [Acidobacteriota bacterium]
MSKREELERAMAALDGQCTALGDAAVEAALVGQRQKPTALDEVRPANSPRAGERRVVTFLCLLKKSDLARARVLWQTNPSRG